MACFELCLALLHLPPVQLVVAYQPKMVFLPICTSLSWVYNVICKSKSLHGVVYEKTACAHTKTIIYAQLTLMISLSPSDTNYSYHQNCKLTDYVSYQLVLGEFNETVITAHITIIVVTCNSCTQTVTVLTYLWYINRHMCIL